MFSRILGDSRAALGEATGFTFSRVASKAFYSPRPRSRGVSAGTLPSVRSRFPSRPPGHPGPVPAQKSSLPAAACAPWAMCVCMRNSLVADTSETAAVIPASAAQELSWVHRTSFCDFSPVGRVDRHAFPLLPPSFSASRLRTRGDIMTFCPGRLSPGHREGSWAVSVCSVLLSFCPGCFTDPGPPQEAYPSYSGWRPRAPQVPPTLALKQPPGKQPDSRTAGGLSRFLRPGGGRRAHAPWSRPQGCQSERPGAPWLLAVCEVGAVPCVVGNSRNGGRRGPAAPHGGEACAEPTRGAGRDV